MRIGLHLSSLIGTLAVSALIAPPTGAAPADIVFSDGGDLYARSLDGAARPLTRGRPGRSAGAREIAVARRPIVESFNPRRAMAVRNSAAVRGSAGSAASS